VYNIKIVLINIQLIKLDIYLNHVLFYNTNYSHKYILIYYKNMPTYILLYPLLHKKHFDLKVNVFAYVVRLTFHNSYQ